ncbi:MAG: hypothetical protein AAGA58_13710 [Verrucomicrobiota bacterium]
MIDRLVFAALLVTASSAVGLDLADVDRYGGVKAIESEATGWFRVEKINGRWLFITPEGHGYLALGANHVGKYLDQQAEAMGLLARARGSREEAASYLLKAMADLGLNAGEAYAPIAPEIMKTRPWVANIDFPGRSKFAFDVFDQTTLEEIHDSFVEQCQDFQDNRFVLGVACADLPVWDQRRIEFYEKLPESAPGKRELMRFREEGKSDDEFLGHVAAKLYPALRKAVKEGAPNHLFFGERFRLRGAPDEVIAAVGRHVDVFPTQALILSPQRPPEWQLFQAEGYDHEASLIGDKPMVVIDWAAPFSLSETFDTERGQIRDEITAAKEAADWIIASMERPYMIGVFKCQLIGLHGNDRWFGDRARRTYLQDDGRPFPLRTRITREAHEKALMAGYSMAVK